MRGEEEGYKIIKRRETEKGGNVKKNETYKIFASGRKIKARRVSF
jgi:hypothetical protein